MLDIDINELKTDSQQQKVAQKVLTLAEVTALGQKMNDLEAEIEDMEQLLCEKKEELHNIAEGVLPEALANIGLKSLSLADGTEIGIKEYISASINDDNRSAAHNWLRQNGYDDLIKNDVVVSFGKGEDEYAQKLLQEIGQEVQNGDIKCGGVAQVERVHPSTLKAFLKEQLKVGAAIPAKDFNLVVGQIATIKKKKKQRI